jgi:hypothetical protein
MKDGEQNSSAENKEAGYRKQQKAGEALLAVKFN